MTFTSVVMPPAANVGILSRPLPPIAVSVGTCMIRRMGRVSTKSPGQTSKTQDNAELDSASDDCWKHMLLKKLYSRGLQPDGLTNSWQYFKMPNSWVRNGDLNVEKFRLLDQIESRGERCHPVKVYESTNPKLSKYLYIRRNNSYSIWKVPRPDNCSATGVLSYSTHDTSHKAKITAELLQKVAALDPATVHRISSTPLEIWDRMVQLPISAWDDVVLRAKKSGQLEPLTVGPPEKPPDNRTVRRRQRRVRPRRGSNPSDRGDGLKPSKIPLPTGLREFDDGTLRYLTAMPNPKNILPAAADCDDIGSTAQRRTSSALTEAIAPVSTSSPPAQEVRKLPLRRPKLSRSPAFRVSSTQTLPHPNTRGSQEFCTVRCKSPVVEKWWRDDLALSPRLMKVESLEDSTVEYRREEDGELVELGKGSVSTVYLAELIQYGKTRYVAVKEFNPELVKPYNIRKEAGIMRVLSGTGFVPHLFGFLSPNLSLVQEFFGQGTTLEDLLGAAHVFNLPSRIWLSIATHIAVALREFFKRGILHNDIKSENILVDWDTPDYPIKFIDMGRATYKTGFLYTERSARFAKWNQLAPELNLITQTTPATEVYSLGAVLDSIASKGGLPEMQPLAKSCRSLRASDRPDIRSVIQSLEHLQRRVDK